MLLKKRFFNKEQEQKIIEAIQEAESMTSGEIRVHIEKTTAGVAVLERAKKIFFKIGMQKTEQRNGVLIYLAVADKQFAIVGDQGIHAIVGDNFWDTIKADMQEHFKKDEFVTGLVDGIKEIGRQLKRNFPCQRDDSNELSDSISMEE